MTEFSRVESDRRSDHSARSDSTQLTSSQNVQNWENSLTSTVELSRIVGVIIAPDLTQLNQLSCVELSRIGRYDQGLDLPLRKLNYVLFSSAYSLVRGFLCSQQTCTAPAPEYWTKGGHGQFEGGGHMASAWSASL